MSPFLANTAARLAALYDECLSGTTNKIVDKISTQLVALH
jgi:hypothetical protein